MVMTRRAAIISHSDTAGHPPSQPRTITPTPWVLTLLVVFGILGNSGKTEAQCVRGAVVCANMTAMRTCTATLMCSNAPSYDIWQLLQTMSTNVTACTPSGLEQLVGSTVTFALGAMAPTSAAPTRSCGWRWRTLSTITSGNTLISDADGLPVELMDFGFEDDDTAGTEDEEHRATDEDRSD